MNKAQYSHFLSSQRRGPWDHDYDKGGTNNMRCRVEPHRREGHHVKGHHVRPFTRHQDGHIVHVRGHYVEPHHRDGHRVDGHYRRY